MKKYFFMAMATLVVSAAAVVGVKAYNYYSLSPLMKANLEALTNGEIDGGSGLLWEKHWVTCPIAGQIIVITGNASIMAGTYAYDTSILAQLENTIAIYTVVEPHNGQKSYCYDGWKLCSEDPCR